MMSNWYGGYGGWSNMMNQWTVNNGVLNFGGSFAC